MKKLLSLVLIVTLLLGAVSALSSCSHECEFSTEWSKDDVAHYHTCIKKEGCTETADKADHVWNEGAITTKQTVEADGVKTFTCTVCAHTKTEVIPKCVLSTDYQKDETSHWRTCVNAGCTELYEKADHTWDEGEITTKATQDADGVKTFTCTVCAQTKTESVAFTGMSRSEWDATLASSVFENFSYSEISTVSAPGISMEVEVHYKFTEDEAWIQVVAAGTSEDAYSPDKESAIETRQSLYESIIAIASYSSYEYDADTKSYVAIKPIYIASLEGYASDVTLSFKDGKLSEILYTVSTVEDGVSLLLTSTVTISDYGTVVLPLPEKDTSGGTLV